MRVIEHILATQNPSFFFEVIPPARGRNIREVLEIVEALLPFNPKWIDVTSHSVSADFQEKSDGTISRRTYKKRPGTLGICGIIQNRFKIDTVAHVLCLGFSREETEDALIELNYMGVENVLALRGDGLNYEKRFERDKSSNEYASDLVRQIRELNEGKYLSGDLNSEPLHFCVGVAGYPEKHFEAANLKTDIQYLKKKVEAGAQYIVSQMLFDNAKFYSWVKECRAAGIGVPIIPGLKVLRSKTLLKTLPKIFHIDLPECLVEQVTASPDRSREIGLHWCQSQV